MKKIEYEELKKHISILNVAHQLDLEVLDKNGNEIYVVCPFCGYREFSKKADMKLNIEKNSYHCFSCGKSGYSIGLYAKLRCLDNRNAFKELIQKEPFSMDKSNFIINANNELTDIEFRDMVYRDFLNRLNLSTKHKRKLESLGLCKSYIKDFLFKSIPSDKFSALIICHNLSKKYNLAGIPGFFQQEDFKWIFSKPKGIYIPIYSSTGRIKGLSILLDKEFNGTNSIWFSSNNRLNGTPAENWLTSFNLNESTDTIILTDDFITAHVLNLGLKVPILAFSSIQNSKNIIKKLKSTNIKNIIFTVRVNDETQKLDYLIEKLISGLIASGYNVSIKAFKNIEDIYRPDILELFYPKIA